MLKTESWTVKLLSIIAFIFSAGAICFLLLPLHQWVSVAHPILDNPVVGILIGFFLMLLVNPIETRFLLRFTDQEYLAQFPSPNRLFRNIQPVSYGVAVGGFLAFASPIVH